MSIEEFERKPFERKNQTGNIGDIGNIETTKNREAFANQTFDMIENNYEHYNRLLMERLILKYGEEEGQKRYAALKQDAEERLVTVQKLCETPESEERHSRLHK